MASSTFHVHIGIDYARGESVTSVHFHDGTSLNDLRGVTGGLVLVPMTGKCDANNHANTSLLSPNVMLHADPREWKRPRCKHCRSFVSMKPDYAKLYGKQP